MRARALVLTTMLAGALIAACGTPAPPEPGDGAATVVVAIDGDTIDADIGGAREHIRLLGIDTPETKHPSKPVECFGPEAAARLAELLPPGTPVTLTRDAEARDDFGRLLAYVQRDDVLVNLVLVEEGYAETLSIEPNTTYATALSAAEAAARAERRGMWGACPLG